MNNDDFLAKCKSIDPSAEVDRNKNFEVIKTRLLKEEERYVMTRNKKIKRPAVAAALLAGVMLFSVAAYAAVPAVWRYFDTRVVQGEEFIAGFYIAEIDLPDGTTSIASGMNIDREALEAAGGGIAIVEVDGEEWVVLDELHLNNLEDGMALLQLDNVLLPGYLPEGFSFSKFTFPVNPNNHQYAWGNLPAAENARAYFTNEAGDVITIQIGNMHDMLTLGIASDQQGLEINGKSAVLSGSFLDDGQLALLENVALFEGYVFDESSPESVMASRNDGKPHLVVAYNGIVYGISAESQSITAYDLVRMAESMK
ncbi:MAG: hypothetical protein FWC93_03890 [Defluviitaleaceae bacterium]|nr:hypothetical protein [Defluviitaleaceae bacterium]